MLPAQPPQKNLETVTYIDSWPAFCKWRGISLSSPLPLLLTWPLTLWHSVERLLDSKAVLSDDRQDSCAIGKQKVLRVLVAGAAAVEVSQLACLRELQHLWPAIGMFLVALVGPGISIEEHGSMHVLGHDGTR